MNTVFLLSAIAILSCQAGVAIATESDSTSSTAEETTSATEQQPPQPPLVGTSAAPTYEPAAENSVIEQAQPATNAAAIDGDKQEQAKKWTDTHPNNVSADWLQLTTGEWLRGHIIAMQQDSLDFDSDELDILTIEWKKVRYIKSAEPYSLLFDGNIIATGKIEITSDKVYVENDYANLTFDRKHLQTIASGKETELSYWKIKISFGYDMRRGNTEQTDITSRMNAKRRTTDSRLTLDYLGNFTSIDGSETVNNNRFNESYGILITRNFYWSPIFSEYYSDRFQNIDQQISLGIGIGYSLINTPVTKWDISGGPSYQRTKYVSVQGDGSTVDNTLTLALTTTFDTSVNSKVDIEGTYSPKLGASETGNYMHHSIITIETEITKRFDFDVSFIWDFVRQPVPDENGNIPYRSDIRTTIGITYEL
jgi:putative salt-induced outer membrane protein YdiY